MSSGRRAMVHRALGAKGRRLTIALALSVPFGCARPQAPDGGPVPEMPLRVIESDPSHLSNVEPFEGPVVLRFQRTLSGQVTSGAPETAVVVSPESGAVAVETEGETLEISMAGGFRETTVYRITILPRFQDRYQNAMERPYDLVFSTGPELEPNLLAGLVTDRLTLEPAEDIRVDAVDPEGIAHSTITDSTGIFALPYLPSGSYRVGAYRDQDRDRTADFTEPQDSAQAAVSPGDTLLVTDLEILQPDTTAAILQDVVAIDSVTLRAEFDDYIDAEASLEPVQAQIEAVGGGAVVTVSEVLHAWEWQERQAAAAQAEVEQAAQAQGAAGDPDQPAGAAPGQPPPGGQPQDAPGADPAPPPDAAEQQEGPPLPAQELILVLGLELGIGTPWSITLTGVPNINGVPGGGGNVEMVREAPPAPEPEPQPEPDDEPVPGAAAPGDPDAAPDADAPTPDDPDPDPAAPAPQPGAAAPPN